MKILLNDGTSQQVIEHLTQMGFELLQVRVALEQLPTYTKNKEVDVLWVENGTYLDKQTLDELGHIKAIVWATTNIDLELVDYAKSNGIKVIWPEESLSNATAEMVFAHLFSGARLLQESNRNMPLEGDTSFKFLHDSYKNGFELAGKTLGIIGMNSAGELVAQKALALGMHVVYHDPQVSTLFNEYILPNSVHFKVELESMTKKEVLQQSHFISVHPRFYQHYLVDTEDFQECENLLGIVNCAYPTAINEVALVDLVNEEKVFFAGLDRFEEEPKPAITVLMQPNFSLSANTNSSTDSSEALFMEEVLEKVKGLLP
ncbi:NAD(P)-dependent oxidoreductase [Myroides sp. LJL116]